MYFTTTTCFQELVLTCSKMWGLHLLDIQPISKGNFEKAEVDAPAVLINFSSMPEGELPG